MGFVLTSKGACFEDVGMSVKEDELVEEGIQSEMIMPGKNGAVW